MKRHGCVTWGAYAILVSIATSVARSETIDSGIVENTGSEAAVVFSTNGVLSAANSMYLTFDTVLLSGDEEAGTGSFLRITSAEDGAVQTMRASHITQWMNQSAFFNGNDVEIELIAYPGTGDNRIVVEPQVGANSSFLQTSGLDRRSPSNDRRTSRVMKANGGSECTAFIIDDTCHCMLTAEHCRANLFVVEFNVPISDADGQIAHPPPSDQYAVDPDSLQFPTSVTLGDWCYFGCFPNSNTGLTPFERQQEFFTLATVPPPVGNQTIKVTGYGATWPPADKTRHRVQQSDSGDYTGFIDNSTPRVLSDTSVSTGNSGGPMLNRDSCEVIGIAAQGTLSGTSGTAVNNTGLRSGLGDPKGVCIPDCNDNDVPDWDDVSGATSQDCSGNGIPDECEPDCNTNGVPDSCDITAGTSQDCSSNGIPDECEPNCNTNGQPDDCDLIEGTSSDCNCSRIPDECEIATGSSPDCNDNAVPDECEFESDCNFNGIPDECDIASGTSADCNSDGVPNECEADCNLNMVSDICDLISATSVDCNTNDIPDECDIAEGVDRDCNGNSVLDSCDIDVGTSSDCNSNSIPDECDSGGFGDLFQAITFLTANQGLLKQFDSSSSEYMDFFPNPQDIVSVGSLLGIAFDDRGNLWLGDKFEHQIHVVDAFTGEFKDVSVPMKSGGLHEPWDMEFGPNGNLFVANVSSTGVTATGILEFDSRTGGFLGIFASDSLVEPLGLTFGPNGNLFVCDKNTAEVLEFDGDDGTLIGVFASTNGTDLNEPRSLVFDPDTGNLFVGDGGANAVIEFDGITGELIGTFINLPGFFSTNLDLEYGPDGELYVSDEREDNLHKYNHLTGQLLVEFPIPINHINIFNPFRIAFRPPATDCTGNDILDSCEIASGTSQDCNSNAIPDQCEVYQDCNTNSIQDICDIAAEFSADCDGDNVPDDCESDCNTNGIADDCDLAAGTSTDCNTNGTLDECESANDCNANSINDICDIALGTSGDCNNDNVPNECESDCNTNAIPDVCEIAAGSSADCDGDGTPDECEPDCNTNGVADDCDISGSTSRDCNGNLVPDECDVSAGTSIDCNANIVPDECEICLNDCNTNAIPDECDIASATGSDTNSNGIPDECEDCNSNGILDFNEDCDTNGYAFRHDYDRDGDHDLRDFWYFQRCFNTNGVGTNGVTVADCLCAFDWDTNGARDSVIDLDDFLALVDTETFGLEPQIACWYAAQDQQCATGSQMEMMMGGGGGGESMMMAAPIETASEEEPPEITVEEADLEFELRLVGSEKAAKVLAPNTVYELHYAAGTKYVNDYVLEVVATTVTQGLTSVITPSSGDWSATGNFVFEDVLTEYGSLIPAPGFPDGYYRTDWTIDTFFPYSGKAAGKAGHLCTITTGSKGELELVLHMDWFDLENNELVIMEAALAFDVEADN